MFNTHLRRLAQVRATWPVSLLAIACAGCSTPQSQPRDPHTTAVYNKANGRLEQIVSDHDGDGKPDTRAFMEGTRIVRIELDRDNDGKTDRWEFYTPAPADAPKGTPPSIIERADEASAPDQKITRREFYVKGALARTEEDTDCDGRMDKWEYYENDALTRVEFDLSGHGYPDRRLVYDKDGNVVRVEVDPDGHGKFVPAPEGKKGGGF